MIGFDEWWAGFSDGELASERERFEIAWRAGFGAGRRYKHRVVRPPVLDPTNASVATLELYGPNGGTALISAVDMDLVGQRSWHRGAPGRADNKYAMTTMGRSTRMLHRLIGAAMGLPADKLVDHINGNTFDCRRENLRAATPAENSQNCPSKKPPRSGLKGVYEAHGTWRGKVRAFNKCYSTPKFATKEEANEAVIALRIKLHGEFANHE